MKKLSIILALCFIMFSTSSVFAGGKSEGKRIAKKVYRALKRKNQKKLVKAYISKTTLSIALKFIGKNYNIPEIDGIDASGLVYNMLIKRAKNGFDKTLEKGKEDGINWKKIKFKDVEVKRKVEFENFDMAALHMTIEYEDEEHLINLGNCIKFKGRWILADKIKWKG